MAKIKKYTVLLLVQMIIFSICAASAAGGSGGTRDARLANFRNVRSGKIGRNNLYRSQHPANGSYRSLYANVLAEQNGIKTVLNLSDSKSILNKYFKENIVGYSYYYKTLYNRGRVYTTEVSIYHNKPADRGKIAAGLKFFAKNKGPYLVHCEVGRDRTGLVVLLLECMMGVPYGYMVEDYAQSYINVGGLGRAEAQKKAIGHINDDLCFITGKSSSTDWSKVDPGPCVEGFLIKNGMSRGEITALKKNLSVSYPEREVTLRSCCIVGTDGNAGRCVR